MLLMSLLIGSLAGLTLEELEVSFEAAHLKEGQKTEIQTTSLKRKYLGALKREKTDLQKDGNLDGALLLKAEIDLASSKVWPLPALPATAGAKLKKLRATYLESHIEIERDWAVITTQLAEKMQAALQQQVESLTKEGKLEDAKNARVMMEEIAQDPEIVRAKELPSRFTQGGHSRIAYQVRRPGDGIEVKVRYDGSGKISLDSPIENTVELSGGRRERGTTKARTLGEFIGAEGYQVSLYQSADLSVEAGNLEIASGNGVLSKTAEIAELKCVEFKISPTAVGPYFNLSGNLPINPEMTTFEVEVEYFVPSDNQQVNGLSLRHGDSRGKNLGAGLNVTGKWSTEKRSAMASHTLPSIRIYFAGIKKVSEARGDRLYIRRIRVSHLRFPAFIVESFDEQGAPEVREFDREKQSLLAKNGELVDGKL